MQITTRPHVPTPAALAQSRGRSTPTQTATAQTATASTDAVTTSGTDATAAAGPTTTDRPGRPGGSDTPFTHALERGNGRKLGIHRRLPTAEDVAAEQQAAGLSSEVPATEAPPTDATSPVDVPVLDVAAPEVQAPEESLLDTLLDAADPVDLAAGGVSQDEPILP